MCSEELFKMSRHIETRKNSGSDDVPFRDKTPKKWIYELLKLMERPGALMLKYRQAD